MIYGNSYKNYWVSTQTSYNRPVYASPPVGGSGYGFARSIALLIPTQNLRHILSALEMLRISLFGPPKRRKQPKRYAKCNPKICWKIILEKILILWNNIFMEYCIYKTDDDYKAKMVVNILKKNKIMTFCKNMYIQNLFGYSKLITGSDLIVGEIKIYAKEKDVGKAKQIINHVTFIKQKIKTIENDEIKKDTYISQRTLIFSFATLFIIPFFFNLEYLIYCFRKKLRVRYISLGINIFYLLFSMILCANNFDYIKFIWKGNLFFTLFFSIEKYIDLDKEKSKLKFLMIVPIILLILSYHIVNQIFGIKIFG
jgi:hypothetical protein